MGSREIVSTKMTESPSSLREGKAGLIRWAEAALRVVLLAATVVSVVVMVTSDQTELAYVNGLQFPLRASAKFTDSPAFIYYVAAISTAGFYSIITVLVSVSALWKRGLRAKCLLLFALGDAVMLGIVAAATGAAGAVAYIGFKGNNHTTWIKVCPVFDNFCQRLGISIFISLFAAVLLIFLSIFSTFSLYRQD